MTHRLATNCAKNYCNRTLIVKVIVENVLIVTCFLGTQCRALESVSIASALSTALTMYPCQIRVHHRWQSKLQLLTARKKEWWPATANILPQAVTCQHCDTHYFSRLRTHNLPIVSGVYEWCVTHLWKQLPSSFRQPYCVHSPPGSPHPAHITSSQSPPSFSASVTPSTFHSRLKTHLFHKSFPP